MRDTIRMIATPAVVTGHAARRDLAVQNGKVVVIDRRARSRPSCLIAGVIVNVIQVKLEALHARRSSPTRRS